MNVMLMWLRTNSETSVIYKDLSSFQVYMELFTFHYCAFAKHWNSDVFAKKIFRKFYSGIVKKLRRFQYKARKLSCKKTCFRKLHSSRI